jgi:hypothetical protein
MSDTKIIMGDLGDTKPIEPIAEKAVDLSRVSPVDKAGLVSQPFGVLKAATDTKVAAEELVMSIPVTISTMVFVRMGKLPKPVDGVYNRSVDVLIDTQDIRDQVVVQVANPTDAQQGSVDLLKKYDVLNVALRGG